MPSYTSPNRFARVLAGAALSAAFLVPSAAHADVSSNCDRVAAPGGSDSAAGTLAAPYATAGKLASSLSAGQTGCLRAGTYTEDLRVPQGGITLRSYPGERARLVGRLWIPRGSDNVTIAFLDLDGRNGDTLPSPTVNAGGATFTGNDVSNENTTICFVLGSNSYGRATGTVITGNRIHNCGILPAANHDHGIYVSNADDTQITNNVIYDNADRGIQLYPDAQRTLIQGNIIDGNGEGVIFSGDGGVASNDNVVQFNVITNSLIRNNVESWYPSGNPVGTGNVLRNNCVFGGVRDTGNGGIGSQIGFTATSNLIVDPGYANRAAKDFTLAAGSPCAQILAGASTSDVNPPPVAPPTSGTTTTDSGSGSGSGSGKKSGSKKGGPHAKAVTLGGHARRGGRIRIKGRIRLASVSSASVQRNRVTIQLHWKGAWYPLASTRVRGSRFADTLKLPRYLLRRTLTLRAVVPALGSSKHVRIRAGR